ncbi:MAG: 4Fe-4S binding protein [Coriobacteriales bacterium]|jgi:Pyruvate/2-oxoacid:ferredoxin oxidoreductase delta subunit
MRISTRRTLVAAAFFILICVGLFVDTGLGTTCSFGWDFIAAVCPVGVIASFIAGRSVPVTGVICLAITVVLALMLGRAFCGWLCPVPLERRLFGGRRAADRSASSASCVGVMYEAGVDLRDNDGYRMRAARGSRRPAASRPRAADLDELYDEYYHPFRRTVTGRGRQGARAAAPSAVADLAPFDEYYGDLRAVRRAQARLTRESAPAAAAGGARRAAGSARAGEVEALDEYYDLFGLESARPARRAAPASPGADASTLRAGVRDGRLDREEVMRLAHARLPEVPEGRVRVRAGRHDIRLAVLAVALVAALLFGFPVFCLVCPVGLTFATLVMVVQIVRTGAFSWGVLVFPALIAVELVALRRWCHVLCPIGALVGLVARGNRTLRPTVDEGTCVEIAHHASCGRCHLACPEGIDPHRPGAAVHISECTKCAECVFACPTGALTMPFLPRHHGGRDAGAGVAGTSAAMRDMERAVEEKLGPAGE